jgi:hypothetical protein
VTSLLTRQREVVGTSIDGIDVVDTSSDGILETE